MGALKAQSIRLALGCTEPWIAFVHEQDEATVVAVMDHAFL
jgi:hypothetical protein